MAASPAYIYLVAGSGKPMLVELSLLESMPSGWFQQNFGRASHTARPAPLPEPHRGLPVYGVPTTAGILTEIVQLLRFPQLLAKPKAKNKVPLSLAAKVDLDEWRLSLEYFGFNEWNVIEEDEDTKRAVKKAKLEQSTSPTRIEFLQAFATALAADIRAKHPRWGDLAIGSAASFACDYVLLRPTGNTASTVSVPLSGRKDAFYAAVLLKNCIVESERSVLIETLVGALAPLRYAQWEVMRDGKAKKATPLWHWPATEQIPTKQLAADADCLLVRLTVSHSIQS